MIGGKPQPTQFASTPEPLPPSPPGEPVPIGEDLEHLEKESKTQTFVVVAIVLGVIALVIAGVSYMMRPKPKAAGSIDEAYAVALPGDNVLATIRVTLQNVGGKPLYIREIKAKVTTAEGKEFQDVAASAVDFDRYFRGYPDLREHSIQPLRVETRVNPGEQVRGSVIASFPMTLDVFNGRKSITVLVQPYAAAMAPGASEAPVEIKK